MPSPAEEGIIALREEMRDRERGCPNCSIEFECLNCATRSTPDQSELFDIAVTVVLFTNAWDKGDDGEIQKAVDLIFDWQKRRQDRLAKNGGVL